MLEKVTQQSWEQLIKQFVFEPLQISGGFGWPASKDINQPWAHWWNSDSTKLIPVSPRNKWYIPDLVDPAGDISMSVLDYGKWLQKNLKGLKGKIRNTQRSIMNIFIMPISKVRFIQSVGCPLIMQASHLAIIQEAREHSIAM